MKSSEVITLLNEIEDRFPVDEWMVENVHVWPFIRMQIATDAFAVYLGVTKRNSSTNFNVVWEKTTAWLTYLGACIKDRQHNSGISENVSAVLVSDGFARDYIGGAWRAVYYDQIIRHLNQRNKNYLHLEFKHKYLTPRFTPSKYIQPHLDYLTIKNRFFTRDLSARQEALNSFDDFRNFLESKGFGIQAPSPLKIRAHMRRILSLSHYYEQIFKKTKPLACFFVCYQNDYGMAYNLACRRLGIPSVDIQHGFQGDLNPAYGRWNKIPATGYELLPRYFLVWSKREEEVISKWSRKASSWHKPIVAGNLWLNAWKNGNDEIVHLYDQKITTIKNINAGSIHVLLTLQIGLSDYKTLKEVLDVMRRTQNDWLWWVRLPPNAMRDHKKRITRLFNNHGVQRFELRHATEFPLHALLRNIDVHITHCSSTILEAEIFGVPSVIISEYSDELFSEQINSTMVLPAYISGDIEKAICRQYKRKIYFDQIKAEKHEPIIDIGNILESIGINDQQKKI